MKRHRMFSSAFLLALALTVAAGLGLAQEATPQGAISPQALLGTAFTYQGRLTDDGQPATGVYDFQFNLYDADAGGNQVGPTLFVDNITLAEGLFTASLDFGPAALTGPARWLEVWVKRNVDPEIPSSIPGRR